MGSFVPISGGPISGGSASSFLPIVLPGTGQFVCVTITRPDLVTERYSREGFVSPVGLFEPRISDFGSVTYEQSDPEGNMQSPTCSFRLLDPDNRILQNIVAGVQYIDARVDITLSNGPFLFSGRISDFQPGDQFSWQVGCRPRDRALSNNAPSTVFALQDFPNMDRSLIGKTIPWAWGTYDSAGVGGDRGAVPTFYVNTATFTYLVAFGWVTVMRVYKDKANVAVGGGWTVLHTVINGRRYTLIDWAANQGTSEITADIFGYLRDPNQKPSTGLIDTQQPQNAAKQPIQEAGEMAVHVLTNLLLSENQTGVFTNVAHPDIDAAAFAAIDTAITNTIPYRFCPYFNQQFTGYAALNEMSKMMGWVLFWNELGQISVASPWGEPNAGTISTPWVREDGDVLDVRRAFQAKDKVARIVGSYGQNPADAGASTGTTRQGTAHALSGKALPDGSGELNITSQFAPAFV